MIIRVAGFRKPVFSPRRFALLAAVWVALAGAHPSLAKDKAEPAPLWATDAAKTPTPTDIHNAPAVVLYDEYLITVDAQNRAVEDERYAVRILAPQGRQYAQCREEYDKDEKLDFFHSWTITPDGRQFQAKETDFRDVGAYGDQDMQSTERFRIVNPPGSDPGAVVACETEVHLRPYMDEEEWEIQGSIPFVEEALELVLPPGGHFSESWDNYAPVKPVETEANHLRWEIRNMPQLDLENAGATPAWEALAARMAVKWGDAAVNGTQNQWRQIGQWQDQLEEHRPDPDADITAKALELTAGAPDLYTKLSRITEYIQKNIRYFIVLRGIGGWQAHPASDIYRDGYGDCKDKTTLLISMLQAIGIRAHYLMVDSERGVINPAAPSVAADHMITAIELPDGENDPRLLARVKTASGKSLLIFDPTDEETPVGLIRGALQGAWGSLADGADSQVIQMPVLPASSAGLSRKGSFVLSADGSLTGEVHEIFTGDNAATERWFLKDNDTKEVQEKLENGLGNDLPGLTLQSYGFQNDPALNKPVGLDMHFSVASYAHSSGPLLLFRPRILGSDTLSVPGIMEGRPRLYNIDFDHPGRWSDTFDIALPAGYGVDETPDPVNLDLGFAAYHSSVTAKDGVLHYEREYTVRTVEIPPAKAAALRQLEEAIVSDEKGFTVLSRK